MENQELKIMSLNLNNEQFAREMIEMVIGLGHNIGSSEYYDFKGFQIYGWEKNISIEAIKNLFDHNCSIMVREGVTCVYRGEIKDGVYTEREFEQGPWCNVVFPLIDSWSKKSPTIKQTEIDKARRIRDYRSIAHGIIKRKLKVVALELNPDSREWENLLEQGKREGIIPEDEVWTGTTVRITMGENEILYVNQKHPEFYLWSTGGRSGFAPSLSVNYKTNQFILPYHWRNIVHYYPDYP